VLGGSLCRERKSRAGTRKPLVHSRVPAAGLRRMHERDREHLDAPLMTAKDAEVGGGTD
jgi:hypothetical protein